MAKSQFVYALNQTGMNGLKGKTLHGDEIIDFTYEVNFYPSNKKPNSVFTIIISLHLIIRPLQI